MDFRIFWRRHRSYIAFFVILAVGLVALDGWLIYKRHRYESEIARLRAGMTDFERKKTDAVLAANQQKLSMMMELIRRQAKLDPEIHLAVSVDSGMMYLGREGALLRASPVRIGPERRVGAPPDTVHLAVPRGTRSILSILDGGAWEVPRWVYRDRGLPVPPERTLSGALGPTAILLDGGTVIYSLPKAGPLADTGYVLPGSVRARAADLEAVEPNLKPGMQVYFY